MANSIEWIVAEAKRLKRKYPKRFKQWKDYVKQASAIYRAKHKKGKIGKTTRRRRRVSSVTKKINTMSHRRHYHRRRRRSVGKLNPNSPLLKYAPPVVGYLVGNSINTQVAKLYANVTDTTKQALYAKITHAGMLALWAWYAFGRKGQKNPLPLIAVGIVGGAGLKGLLTDLNVTVAGLGGYQQVPVVGGYQQVPVVGKYDVPAPMLNGVGAYSMPGGVGAYSMPGGVLGSVYDGGLMRQD